jgi:hypothetical protein
VKGAPVASGYCHSRVVPALGRGTGERFHAVEARECPHHARSVQHRHIPKTDRSLREWCNLCGGHLFTEHPHWQLIDVYAAVLPQLHFSAGVHVNYHESVLRIQDGSPKFNDLPNDMGGSGVTLPE